MAANSVRCPDCGSPVPVGRLSCASCGALLASVSGTARPAFVSASMDASAEVAEFDESLPIGGWSEPNGPTGPDSPVPDSPVPDSPVPDLTGHRPTDTQPGEPDPARPPESAAERHSNDVEPDPGAGQATVDRGAHDASAFGTQPVAAGTTTPTLANVADARPSHVPPLGGPGPMASADPILGAYLPPSRTYRAPASGAPADRSSTSAPAHAPALRPSPEPSSLLAPSPSPRRSPSPSPSLQLDDSVASHSVNWLVLVGCVVATGSFLLPWATDGVIGASGSGFTSTWGLANPGYLLLMAASLSLLGLELTAVRVPAWIRQGLLPLVVGCTLIGVVFVYDARPYGGGTGVGALAVGALLLFVGGLIGVRPGRAEPARSMPMR